MLEWHTIKGYDYSIMGWTNRENGVDLPEEYEPVLIIFPQPFSDGRIYEGYFEEGDIYHSSGFVGIKMGIGFTMMDGTKWARYNRPD